MAAQTTAPAKRLRQFVVRLEQPGIYDRLRMLAYKRTQLSARYPVAMTDLAREALEQYLTREEKKYGL